MNNKICNPKADVPNTNKMNDKDYITTMLSLEKAMVKDFAVVLTEASNNDLYNDYYEMFDEVINMQREIYDLMFKKGWYCLEKAEEMKITQKLNTLEQEFSQLEN